MATSASTPTHVLHKGRFNFQRVTDGVYLAFDTQNDNTLGGVVYTEDVRSRRWNAVNVNGTPQSKSYRTMSTAAESMVPTT